MNAVVAFVGTYLPDIVERRYNIEFRSWQRIYTKTAMLTHAIGMLGPYEDIWWWDHLTHTHSATILGSFVYVTSHRRGRDPRLRVVAGVVFIGVLWEVMEYMIHVIAERLDLEPLLIPTAGPTRSSISSLTLVGHYSYSRSAMISSGTLPNQWTNLTF
jgi:hypothetical protein